MKDGEMLSGCSSLGPLLGHTAVIQHLSSGGSLTLWYVQGPGATHAEGKMAHFGL